HHPALPARRRARVRRARVAETPEENVQPHQETRPMIARKTTSILLIAFAALAGAGCKKADATTQNAQPAADKAPETAIETSFVKVTERKLPATLEASGTLAADETSEVAAATSGIVVKVLVDVGSRVKKGEALVELDRRDPSMRGAAANAQAAQA